MPDFGAVDLAPVVVDGPPLDASNETDVYQSASAVAAAAAQVTAVTNSTLAERGLLLDWLNQILGKSKPKTTSTAKVVTTLPTVAPTTSVSNTATSTTSSSTSCPTTPEEGTFCGFINPEDPCAPQPDGYGPKPTPDTVDAFWSYAPFHKTAQSAVTPKGYIQTFKDLNATVSANSYMGLHTLDSYNVQGCSEWCDNTTLCTAFNIYIERDPSLNPTSGDASKGEYCPMPSSITNYKCTLWGSGVEAAAADNLGGYRGDFHVVVAGSNGYAKTNITVPDKCPGYQPPKPCKGGAINKPSSYLGSKFFPGPYNPSVCAAYGQAQTTANKAAVSKGGKYLPCNFFNAYMMKRNGKGMGTYCALYTQAVDSIFATYSGGWSNGDLYQVESSWSYELTTQDKGIKA